MRRQHDYHYHSLCVITVFLMIFLVTKGNAQRSQSVATFSIAKQKKNGSTSLGYSACFVGGLTLCSSLQCR